MRGNLQGMYNHPAPAPLPKGLFPAIVTIVLLAIPLVAMQFTDEVQWEASDFLVMGALLFTTGLAFEWVLRRKGSSLYRIAFGLGLFATLLMTWANLAVGLIGGEGNPVNALLLVVVAVGVSGSLLARNRAGGMALTLTAMACVQGLIAAVATVLEWKTLRHGPVDIWGPNGLFVLLFLASAVLFRADARDAASAGDRTLRAMLLLAIGGTIGFAGIYVGEMDDAPGAGLMGIVVMVGACALALKVWRHGR
jgi:hypothetical protein